jgi:hypothetical protein
MLRVARTNPDRINLGPNRIIDITTLIQQIRRFVADLNGPQSMSLPPANKETRKNVHELALAFGLKSVSKGKGDARYTTLMKTSRTGLGRIDEWKVDKVVRRAGGRGARGETFGEFEGRVDRRTGRGGVPKQREGDEVGAVSLILLTFPLPKTMFLMCYGLGEYRAHRRSQKAILDSRCCLRWDGRRVVELGCLVDWKHHWSQLSNIPSWGWVRPNEDFRNCSIWIFSYGDH